MPEETSALTKSDPDNVHVFISYAHPDIYIAKALFEILKECGESRVTCFLDQYTITTGDDWRDTIERNIQLADWLIFIYRPGHTYDYCGMEIGMFITENRHRRSSKLSPPGKLFAIHDVIDALVPSSLQNRQNRRVTYLSADTDETLDRKLNPQEESFYARSPIGLFLDEFLSLPANKPLFPVSTPNTLEELERRKKKVAGLARRLTLEFKKVRLTQRRPERLFQYRLQIRTGADSFWLSGEIPVTAMLSGDEATFRLLGYPGEPDDENVVTVSWGNLKEHYRSRPIPQVWMYKVEHDIVNACASGEWPKADSICFRSASDKFLYRPILTRQETLDDGRKVFNIMFIQSRERIFAGDKTTTTLLAALTSASRFYFYFYEQKPEYVIRKFADDKEKRSFDAECRQLMFDIELMVHEAHELGLGDPEDLIDALGSDKGELVRMYYQVFYERKEDLQTVIKGWLSGVDGYSRRSIREAITNFADSLEAYNRDCLRMCFHRYEQEMDDVLDRHKT